MYALAEFSSEQQTGVVLVERFRSFIFTILKLMQHQSKQAGGKFWKNKGWAVLNQNIIYGLLMINIYTEFYSLHVYIISSSSALPTRSIALIVNNAQQQLIGLVCQPTFVHVYT